MFRTVAGLRRLFVACAIVVSASSVLGCGSSPDPQVSVVIQANSASPATLVGPGGVELSVPAGATSHDVTIVLTTPRSRRPAPAGTVSVATPVRLSPEGATFLKPLGLSIPIQPSALPPGSTLDDVVVIRAPQDGDVFVPLPTRRVGNAVVADTEHFSDFLAVVYPAGDGGMPFGACGDKICGVGESCQICPYDCNLCVPSVDVTPPQVVQITPADGSVMASGDATVEIDLDEAADLGADGSPPLNLIETVSGLSVSGYTSASGSHFSFGAYAPLRPLTQYTVELGAFADAAGNLTTPTTFTFTTSAGATLVSSTPVAASTGHPTTSPLTLTFSQPIDAMTLSMQPDDGPCSGAIRLSADGFVTCLGGTVDLAVAPTVITIHPRYELPSAAPIVLTASGVRDSGKFDASSAVALTFTSAPDTRSPVLLSVTPRPGETAIGPLHPVVLTFDEPVIVTNPGGDVGVVDAGANYIAGTATAAGSQITFVPSARYLASTTYFVDVSGQITDRAGNGFSGGRVGVFNTGTGANLVTSAPLDGAIAIHPRADLTYSFSAPLDASTLVYQFADGPCTGTVRVSVDGFVSCLGGSLVIAPDFRSFALKPTTSYPPGVAVNVSFDPALSSLTGFATGGASSFQYLASGTGGFGYAIFPGPLFNAGMPSGIAALDAACDGFRPAGVGPSKSFVVTASRHPCADANCASGPSPVDWVLTAGTSYLRPDGASLFMTDASAPIFTGWPMDAPFVAFSTTTYAMGADTQWMPTGNDCSEFTSGVGSIGVGDATNAVDPTAIAVLVDTCTIPWLVLCVEQVPQTPLPTH